ncbi:MAG: hypothetical protein Q8P18_18280 [Pseudomonadota bacterium]|nr:hypothetical protein [Pseudomonadota bacterium]
MADAIDLNTRLDKWRDAIRKVAWPDAYTASEVEEATLTIEKLRDMQWSQKYTIGDDPTVHTFPAATLGIDYGVGPSRCCLVLSTVQENGEITVHEIVEALAPVNS